MPPEDTLALPLSAFPETLLELSFDPNQSYQTQAVESVCGLLSGQPRNEVELTFALGDGFAAIANRLDLDNETLLANLHTVQRQNGIAPDDGLELISETIQTADGERETAFPNFSVEMETGTGKTFVYIRTALELFRRYGLRKFIVVVPSVAVREGVLATLRQTQKTFRALYDNVPYRSYVYASDNLTVVRQFALSDSVEIMVMTIDSFNKAANVIRQATDRLQGETPIHLVQATRPVLILDEPQNMESEQRVAALAALDPLFALRYSATHKYPYNLLYRLTPFDAYRQGLVKKIEVASAQKQGIGNEVFLRLDNIASAKKTLTAKIAIHKRMADGTVKEQIVTVKPGDDLAEKSARSDYTGYEVDEIDLGAGFVRFANGKELTQGAEVGADKDAIFEAQIHYTVEAHFRKQKMLREQGIKVLSLFFIDRVASYADADGIIRRLFIKAFNALKARPEYEAWQDLEPGKVAAAYFASKPRKGGAAEVMDTSGKSKEDEAAYNLIMKDKEKLLSFAEPVCFLFSHSALREGWDNPNVFQICTLHQTVSETKKRQEVGRGVRLARNQDGDISHEDRVNVLTVVANESYETYVAQLQSELEEAYGKAGIPPPPPNAREKGTSRLRKEYMLKPEFKNLWEKISRKTRYAVTLDTEKLLAEVLPLVDGLEVKPPRITMTKAGVRVGKDDRLEAIQMTAEKTALYLTEYPVPNMVALLNDLMERVTPPVRLTRRTLLEILRRTTNGKAMLDNPNEFAVQVVRVLKDRLADHLVNGIKYQPISDEYQMSQIEESIESWEEYLTPSERGLYDHVIFDSEVEKAFVAGMEKREDVRMYWKLPRWFMVTTPIGNYNPDWAIIQEDRDSQGQKKELLFLIGETKSTTHLEELRPDEKRKIICGGHHFKDALRVGYKILTSASEL